METEHASFSKGVVGRESGADDGRATRGGHSFAEHGRVAMHKGWLTRQCRACEVMRYHRGGVIKPEILKKVTDRLKAKASLSSFTKPAVGTRARLAYELLLQAGQSKCDVIRMGRQHVRKGMMTMKRQKTGTPFNVEITPRLREAIDAMPASNHLTYLITHESKQFTAAGFGNWFRDMCRAAKLPARCTSHGLRKAAATYLAELGATDHQLMAWFGWSSISQAQVYTKAARAKVLAKATGRLITGTGIGSPINPVSQNDEQDTEIIGNKK
jgi:integrase